MRTSAATSVNEPVMLEQWPKQTRRVRSPSSAARPSGASATLSRSKRHSRSVIPSAASLRQAPTFASWSRSVTTISSPSRRPGLSAWARRNTFIEVEGPIITSSGAAPIMAAIARWLSAIIPAARAAAG